MMASIIDLFVLHLLLSSVCGFGTTSISPHSVSRLVTANAPTNTRATTTKKQTELSSSATPGNNDDGDEVSINVLGTRMECCCSNIGGTGIGTGFYRNGYCSTGSQDLGRHTVCVRVTDDFLEFSRAVGNDLSTPAPEYLFPGLKEGDLWCLCAQRWAQAYQAGKAPELYLRATHEKTLDFVGFDILREYALDGKEADRAKGVLDEKRDRLEKLLSRNSNNEGEEEDDKDEPKGPEL